MSGPQLRIDPLSGLRTILADGEQMLSGQGDPQAATSPPPRPGANPSRDLFWSAPAQGVEELLEDAPGPAGCLSECSQQQVVVAAERWRERMRAHADAACLHLAVSDRTAEPWGVEARLYALPFVPAVLARERESFNAYCTRTMGGNALADLVAEEVRQRERIVAIDEEAVCIAPYASRVAYQLMIVPRRPRARFEDDGPTGARLLHDALARLRRRLGPRVLLMMWVRTAPRGGEHYCWRIDLMPRPLAPSALEFGTGLGVNALAPERAAAELREA